ncbi:hypothetical protein C8Q72DRAFT_994638 [Fomitopsis betulina]|nr:hypothetical protein C8Q72DRAFT_994638 [Fomitopsis betulina]
MDMVFRQRGPGGDPNARLQYIRPHRRLRAHLDAASALPQWGFPQGINSEARLNVVRGLSLPRNETPGPAGSTRFMPEPARTPAKTFAVVGNGKNDTPKIMIVDPERVLHKPLPILKGRRTAVYEAKDPDMPTMPYAVKWSYPETTRHNEAKTVWRAHEIIEEMDKDVLGALTDVVAFKDFGHLSTDNIRGHLCLSSDSTQSLIDAKYHGEHILRCIFEEKLKPLTYLADLEFVLGMINCIRCHMLLWLGNGKHRIEHTDTSFWNLGVAPYSLCVKVRDFDLARVVGEPSEPQGSERMGTIPFMALDLLTEDYWCGGLERLYRHDLEAFTWVTVYYAWAFDNEGIEDMHSIVRGWLTPDYVQCRHLKLDFLMYGRGKLPDYQIRAKSPPGYILSFARRISQWLWQDYTQCQSTAQPQIDGEVFAKKNLSPSSHSSGLTEAKHVFNAFWDEIKDIWEIAQDVTGKYHCVHKNTSPL